MTVDALAKRIIGVVRQRNVPVTNLQLQKVLFFTLKQALNQQLLNEPAIEKTYDQPFEVWRYGPVEREIYEKYKVYGADPITERDTENSEYQVLNSVIFQFLQRDTFELIHISHQEKFWSQHETHLIGWRSQIAYTLDDVAMED
ncbi:hypothetical protein FD30_GL000343 [Levilactobacillus namurensis DSM 19117]|uniref:Antitoxin SocA-like Panacea domain-containing protein n=1 Tax=Levilactobacillus namurensis DSM 19117 TaxID=1423773 RepID=A0A0R1JWK8_9LACO|nr:type II toxin-antitoxin system antitoxin SocA domain-containing protein [Levilactobacillus namurensis]KRK73635.1 hypothetical protein FD30_GL000343 [Levilactobacillus namurensis DSM 19117]GEO74436.1 hypothetical protein LNA02_11340 [Levilactobacillus namurensis]HJE45439.1 DUF4065 domain-containing protein [Levilactobacillus namurensis]